ncbi:MAG: hypothetical protein QME52_02655 [Bacteroidota bacterium]|nr:hypothetical protein [Bacteroidota bacterium]
MIKIIKYFLFASLREINLSIVKYISVSLLMVSSSTLSQEQIVKKDTTAMPKLEIPEITIVGKKAISLPFARKGEIYDVHIYEAPSPDTSILMQRPAMSLPIGSLPRYDEPLVPWHVSAEGGLGNFSTFNLRTFVDYKGRKWGIYGNAGIHTTQGHKNNTEGSAFNLQMTSHSLVKTDNDILKSFRVFGGMRFISESYGMFSVSTMDRSRTNFLLDGRLQSLDREKGAFDFGLKADIWSITDSDPGKDSSVVAVSPILSLGYKTRISNVRVATELLYSGSTLDYDHPAETPSLIGLSTSAKWMLMNEWSLYVGGLLQNGSASDGGSRSLLIPFATVKWELDRDRELSFWFNPQMRLESYGELSKQIPYLQREVVLRPERIPFNLGSTFWYNSGIVSIELSSAFLKSTDKRVVLADSGKIWFTHVDAVQFFVKANGTINPTEQCRLTFNGIIQPTYEEGKSTQLPMIPLVQVGGRAEYDFNFPLTVWSSAEFWSKQNIDLDSRFLVGLGGSSDVIPRTLLSFEVSNLLNQKYEWWSGYEAPGIVFNLNAKVNFR